MELGTISDMILQNKGLVPITAIAKDYGMSGVAMNEKLHEMKIIYKMGRQWLLYSKYQAKGYTHSETVNFKHKDGRDDVAMNTKWTQKGRLFLYEKLKEQGILPVIERTA
jgi:phage antirepressor YoqD-like protein